MSDFFQNGTITTLHRLNKDNVSGMEAELEKFSSQRPMGLVLPSLFSELKGPALKPIVDQIAQVSYLNEVIIGLDNATKEEFDLQHYEGASTEFGRYTLSAYKQELSGLAKAIKDDAAVVDDKQPRDRINDYRNERASVVWDGKYWYESFGQVMSNANASYNLGDTVKVTYRGGHPKNNLRIQDTFLKVQKKVGSNWVTVSNDWDWDTLYEWRRDGSDRSLIDITWNIPSEATIGTYRIIHQGNWKNGWTGSIKAYSGTSREFTVN